MVHFEDCVSWKLLMFWKKGYCVMAFNLGFWQILCPSHRCMHPPLLLVDWKWIDLRNHTTAHTAVTPKLVPVSRWEGVSGSHPWIVELLSRWSSASCDSPMMCVNKWPSDCWMILFNPGKRCVPYWRMGENGISVSDPIKQGRAVRIQKVKVTMWLCMYLCIYHSSPNH